jgi:flagellar hook protein FlgE
MSFSTSLSGLSAQQQKLDVIGNNLANLNTVGFKASTVEFSDLVSQSVGSISSNPAQIGLGVTTGSISPNFRQGGVQNTGVATNVSIQGNGFFVIGEPTDRAYTRAGNFSFDANGLLVTPDGKPVQGFTTIDPLTGLIVSTGQPGNISVPPGILRAPVATTLFGTTSNLDSNAAVGATFTASPQIFDALGQPHIATITYPNTAPGNWTYKIEVPAADLRQPPALVGPQTLVSGALVFGASGALATRSVAPGAQAAAADVVVPSPAAGWANGAVATAFTWDLVDAAGVASLTGYASPSATSSITANGSAAGTIDSISINPDGAILATFGAGKTVTIAQLAMANFNNPQGMVKLGSNAYGESAAAGIANVGVAGTGGRGTLIGNSLEQSNVDMAQEFTQMILAQRGYQANSKGISVADELLQVTINLKQ